MPQFWVFGRQGFILPVKSKMWPLLGSKIGGSADGFWVPVLLNGWENFEQGCLVATYWKDPWGLVHLDGLIKSGTVPSTAFTLPPGYRPLLAFTGVAISNLGAGYVDVQANGNVDIGVGLGNVWLSLAGMTFRAEK